MKCSPHKVGIVAGFFFGLAHLTWSIVVALGFGQWFLDFVFSLHMMQSGVTVLSFNLMSAFWLVIVTSLVGYIVGYVLTTIWNTVHKS